ncbi:MAG TPA: dihydrolipoamide acetyltransferase family protein [Actinomycetota bacterium]|nr:dihydrolipoamide acetyltransferase family protein [Actinomycetota bacterium]
MATEVVMPALGVAQETGRIVEWLAVEGETVTEGEPLLEIETDKVTVSIDAPASGILSAVGADDGDEVPVGRVVAYIVAPGEEPPDVPAGRAPAPGEAEPVSAGAPHAQRQPSHGVASHTPGSGGRPLASPLARRRAKEAGIELEQLRGTGPGGAVTMADLDAAIAPRASSDREGAPSEGTPGQRADASEVGAVWRRMAERVTASWTSTPHFFLTREVDAGHVVARSAALGEGVTLTDVLVWLSGRALERHPEVNAVWDGDRPRRIDQINVGIAVAVDDGLIVPVVHRANELDVIDVAKRRSDVVARARSGTLLPEDVTGGTFTLSNLGMFGIDSFTAIVNGPQAAILAVGRVADRVVAKEGRPVVGPRMSLTLSCDHRVLDGARAARFLETLTSFVEEPFGSPRDGKEERMKEGDRT